eukprot:NODE_402_length_1406_cov_320.093589_g296_i0.p1 GENE.NODE_402_length_1406_cov_320.093589_g296_i0~~NODE_402_length_1406_cov_320.093589_g296_i0.p1  ORF type:complete len:319 (-),score=102.66 NODE_402_length_1406_cov_320.093589_g296_i0:49-1005(-)
MARACSQLKDSELKLSLLHLLLELDPPDKAALYYRIGQLNRLLNRREACKAAYEMCLTLDPNNSLAQYKLAMENGVTLSTAPAAYVASLFDTYANTFDDHLVGTLKYRTPGLLLRACLDVAQLNQPSPAASPRWRRCADLGCGTGLAGVLFRPYVDFLLGVDLSGKMVDEARRKACYDELVVGLLEQPLEAVGPDGLYDLIIAADVLVYLGDLGPLFSTLVRATSPGALVGFSVEAAEPPGTATAAGDAEARTMEVGYRLTETGRFVHYDNYIQGLARRHGLATLRNDSVVLRQSAHQPVWGVLYVLQRAPATCSSVP